MHDQADDHTEKHGSNGSGQAELRTEHPRGQDYGQHVDCRTGVQKGRGRTKPGTHSVNSREQRQNGARAYGQNGSRTGCHAISQNLVGRRSEIFHHRGLADENTNGSGNEKCGHKTEQHMLLGVPFHQMKGFQYGVVKARHSYGKIKENQKTAYYDCQRLPLFFPIHDNLLHLAKKPNVRQKKYYLSLASSTDSMQ